MRNVLMSVPGLKTGKAMSWLSRFISIRRLALDGLCGDLRLSSPFQVAVLSFSRTGTMWAQVGRFLRELQNITGRIRGTS